MKTWFWLCCQCNPTDVPGNKKSNGVGLKLTRRTIALKCVMKHSRKFHNGVIDAFLVRKDGALERIQMWEDFHGRKKEMLEGRLQKESDVLHLY
jgi:hypothetical protein